MRGHGRTPLHEAPYEIARLLLAAAADPNIVDSDGDMPLTTPRFREPSSRIPAILELLEKESRQIFSVFRNLRIRLMFAKRYPGHVYILSHSLSLCCSVLLQMYHLQFGRWSGMHAFTM